MIDSHNWTTYNNPGPGQTTNRCTDQRHKPPLVWRTPEGPNGQAAGPPGAGRAGVVSGQGLFRGRWRADRRDKIRPARPLPHSTRDKIRPATSKTSNLECFERAGRTFSRTGRGDVAILKLTTPLRPLMQANVKPPSPLRAPEQQPGGATLLRWGNRTPVPRYSKRGRREPTPCASALTHP